MSYGLRYTATGASKDGTIPVLNVYERDYAGSSDAWTLGVPAFQKQMIYNSDNALEPVVGSTLTVNIIQGDTYDLPDLQTFDDRKYFGELVVGSDVYFRGFLLNDSTTLRFVSGSKYVNLTFVDGLAMLKGIEYVPSSTDYNSTESILTTLLRCIEFLEYKDGAEIYVATSIFADGMNDRGDASSNNPLAQSYLPIRNWQNSDGTFMNCYDVIQDIALTFAAQIFQDEGRFWLVSQYERDNASTVFTTLWNTLYQQDGTIVSAGRKRVGVLINNNNTIPYWQQATQSKIIRKGFNEVVLKTNYQYAGNMIVNPNLIDCDGTTPEYWTIDTATYTSWGQNGYDGYPKMTTNLVGIGGNVFSGIIHDTTFNLGIGDELTVSFYVKGGGGPSTSDPDFLAWISLTDGVDIYYFATENGENKWVKNAGGNARYYQVPAQSTNEGATVSINCAPAPVAGSIQLQFGLKTDLSNELADYGNFRATVQPFTKSIKSVSVIGGIGQGSGTSVTMTTPYTFRTGALLKFQSLTAPQNDAPRYATLISQVGNALTLGTGLDGITRDYVITEQYQYTTEFDIRLGVNGYKNSVNGVLLSSTGEVWSNWYRYGQVEAYASLFDLLVKIYGDQFAFNQINLEGEIYGISEQISTHMPQDPTTGYSVSGRFYVLGNTTIDFVKNTITGTLLEISNEDSDAITYSIYTT